MKPVSNEDRLRIIKHKTNGETEANIAKWLFISKSTVTKIWALFCETGDYTSRMKNSGRKPLVSADKMSEVTAKIEEQPDITLNELIDEFDLPITESALCKRLIKLGYSFKKRLSILKNRNERMLSQSVKSGSQP